MATKLNKRQKMLIKKAFDPKKKKPVKKKLSRAQSKAAAIKKASKPYKKRNKGKSILYKKMKTGDKKKSLSILRVKKK